MLEIVIAFGWIAILLSLGAMDNITGLNRDI